MDKVIPFLLDNGTTEQVNLLGLSRICDDGKLIELHYRLKDNNGKYKKETKAYPSEVNSLALEQVVGYINGLYLKKRYG